MGDLIRREYGPVPDQTRQIQRMPEYQWNPENDSLDIRRYFQVLLKRRWLIAVIVGVVLLLVAVQSFTTTPLYRATAQVQIDPESENVLPYKDVSASDERFASSVIYFETELEVLQSRALARRVIDRLNLMNDPRFTAPISHGIVMDQVLWLKKKVSSLMPRQTADTSGSPGDSGSAGDEALQDAIDTLLAQLDVEEVPNSRIVQVSWASPNSRLAASVADTLAEEYIEQNLQTKFEANTRANEFLKKQLQEMKGKVEKSEEELVKYARDNNIVNIGPDRSNSITLQTLEDLNRQMTVVEGDLIGKTADYQAVRDATADNFPQSLRTPTISLLEERLTGLQQNLASLTAQFGNEWPAVIQVRQQIDEVEKQLVREKRETINRVKSDYQVAVNRREMLKRALSRQTAQANQQNQDSIHYNILQREVDTNRQLYEGLLQRLKETAVAAGVRTSNIHIVDHPARPQVPYAPQRVADLALGFGVGLFIAIGLAFLMEYMDNTVKTPEDMEQSLGLPSLGAIPTMADLPGATTRLLADRNEGGTNPELPARVSPGRFRVWEAYRSLRTSLLLSHSGKPPKLIMVTSTLPGEGKTTTVANTGIVLAQTGARTLLIDLDMRKPALASTLGYSGNQGISAYLSGNADLSSQIRQTNYPNLFLLPAGFRPPNPAELIGSERMETALRLLGDYFKYILIDSPPILSVTDSLLLSPRVDGVVLVIKGGSTPKEAVRKAANHLESVGARILGALINNVDMNAPEYSYYYRHYFDERYNSDLSSAAGETGTI